MNGRGCVVGLFEVACRVLLCGKKGEKSAQKSRKNAHKTELPVLKTLELVADFSHFFQRPLTGLSTPATVTLLLLPDADAADCTVGLLFLRHTFVVFRIYVLLTADKEIRGPRSCRRRLANIIGRIALAS